jgi:hypothetical protein
MPLIFCLPRHHAHAVAATGRTGCSATSETMANGFTHDGGT